MAFPSMLRKRRFLFIVLLAFVLISSGIVVVWQQSATTWRQQQDFLNQQVQAVAPDAVLFVIRAHGTWTPFGIYDLSVEAHYVQPTGEQIFATFSSTVYDTDRRIEWEPPVGSGPISSSTLRSLAGKHPGTQRAGPFAVFLRWRGCHCSQGRLL